MISVIMTAYNSEAFIGQCDISYNKFVGILPVDETGGGIWNHELFAFCVLCDMLKIEMIIEGGTGKGKSGEVFGKYFDIPIYSVDFKQRNDTKIRLKKYANICLKNGNSNKIIPRIINQFPEKRIALCLDGPKDGEGIALAEECFKLRNVLAIGIHDMLEIKDRRVMDAWGNVILYTDEKWYVDKYRHLNGAVTDTERPDGYVFCLAMNLKILK